MTGLTSAQAAELLKTHGPNVIVTKRFTVFSLLFNQFKNPILILLAAAAAISGVLGDAGNALTIGVILTLSVALSLSTEYRAQKAAQDLKTRSTRRTTVMRDGAFTQLDVSLLVPGDVVALTLGSIVPADLRLETVDDLECDESIISGESLPVTKQPADEALMGTVVRSGSATATVVRTGGKTEFGIIAERLSEQAPQTDFQRGLHRFSLFLLWIALIQGVIVIVVSALLGHNLINAVLFALALAVGMTPQLLPAVVSTALALGSKHLAKSGVLVKRLVSIEDLGDIDVLVTDKTGTLTAGAVAFTSAEPFGLLDPVLLGLLATDASYTDAAKSTAGLNPLDAALWSQNGKQAEGAQRLDAIAFDHNRRIASALVVLEGKPVLVSKGSPEDLLARCAGVPAEAEQKLAAFYGAGARVIAVASKPMPGATAITPADESGLSFAGFLTFADPAKPDVAESLKALAALGIGVKICTGDSAQVAATVCRQVGLEVQGVLTGTEIDQLSDADLTARVTATTVFARVSPEQKARILRALRASGVSVGFLGDGVNDAIALHDADVGISVDTATDVAKDAADVVLLEKDLGVLATGVRQGRQVFSNTMKYVLMGTAGDFGNMVSAGIGAMILPFLPMLPSQLLLQDLMYDSSQLGIPSDNVDPEQTAKPSHWSIRYIGKFMVMFGLASSIFDFATFALMTWVFHAKAAEFQTGWFMESLATATLIVFAVRTCHCHSLRHWWG
jgi:Mg2+-importing ATPase